MRSEEKEIVDVDHIRTRPLQERVHVDPSLCLDGGPLYPIQMGPAAIVRCCR